jgi:5-methyltetrahydrofolate--homocysteine methyltransferase
VASSLLSGEKVNYERKINEEYESLRKQHANKQSQDKFISLAEARANKFKSDWKTIPITKPAFIGNKAFSDYSLADIAKYIDWTPFFHAWEMKGSYPKILSDPERGTEAKKLFDDAKKMLDKVIAEKWLTAKAVIGFYPANTVNDDDIEIYTDDGRKQVKTVFHTLRQQTKKAEGQVNTALADFIAPKETGKADYIGGFAVTAGIGIEKWIKKFEKEQDDYSSIMLKALADRLAEAFAELMHEKVRKEIWGYVADEKLSNEQLIKEEYVGIRPAPGYPASPDHTEKRLHFNLLEVEKNTEIQLTESMAMYPTAAVSGLYFAHPQSYYFALGKINKEQLEDYARRKGMSIEEAEKWMRPNLSYL